MSNFVNLDRSCLEVLEQRIRPSTGGDWNVIRGAEETAWS